MNEGPNFGELQRRTLAALLSRFGSRYLEEALDATQEALYSALQTWPARGEPDSPFAWVLRIAERKLIDALRREKRHAELPTDDLIAGVADTSELALYQMACSNKLGVRERICLVLRVCGGLTAAQIGRLLHESEEAVQRRITRSKAKLEHDDLVVGDDWDSLLLIFYLLFTEGYEVTGDVQTQRPDLALSALRLAQEFAKKLSRTHHSLEALLAMMHFLISRFPVRVDENGSAILLQDQNPNGVDPYLVRQGFLHLERAQGGDHLSRYHIEAGLAAAMIRQADSQEVLYWHELLIEKYPSPMSRLSHAIAIGKHLGWSEGLIALQRLTDDPVLRISPYFLGAIGFALADLGEKREAALWYERAAKTSMSSYAAVLFEKRIQELNLPDDRAEG